MGRASAFSCFDAFAATSYKISRYHIVAALDRINTARSTIAPSPTHMQEDSVRMSALGRTQSDICCAAMEHACRRAAQSWCASQRSSIGGVCSLVPSRQPLQMCHWYEVVGAPTSETSGNKEKSLDLSRTDAGWAKLGSKLRYLARGVVDLRNQ